ncbi:MAG TPA: hypothetical protein PKJ45_14655, partial [Rubrivivax sp.]|nr:hypothetical protein [Rubrivivax sp.]
WREDRAPWWDDFEGGTAGDGPVLDALLDGPADVLVLSRCQQQEGGRWPSPRALLQRESAGARLHGDPCVEIWDLGAVRGGPPLPEPTPRPRKGRRRRVRPGEPSA